MTSPNIFLAEIHHIFIHFRPWLFPFSSIFDHIFLGEITIFTLGRLFRHLWEASAALPSLRLGQRRRQQPPAAGHRGGAGLWGPGGHRGRQRAAARRAAPRYGGGHGGLPVAQLRCSARGALSDGKNGRETDQR